MLSSLVKDNKLGKSAQEKVSKAFTKLFAGASSKSFNENSEKQTFYIAPKGAADPQSFDLTQVNLHTLSALIEARKAIDVEKTGFKDNYFSLYRNYFEARAQAGQSVQTVFYSLRGLKNL